jgi:hypothetical protein
MVFVGSGDAEGLEIVLRFRVGVGRSGVVACCRKGGVGKGEETKLDLISNPPRRRCWWLSGSLLSQAEVRKDIWESGLRGSHGRRESGGREIEQQSGGRDALSSGSGKSERRETSQARQRQGGFVGCHQRMERQSMDELRTGDGTGARLKRSRY